MRRESRGRNNQPRESMRRPLPPEPARRFHSFSFPDFHPNASGFTRRILDYPGENPRTEIARKCALKPERGGVVEKTPKGNAPPLRVIPSHPEQVRRPALKSSSSISRNSPHPHPEQARSRAVSRVNRDQCGSDCQPIRGAPLLMGSGQSLILQSGLPFDTRLRRYSG